jgi:serine/threonine-protein kinase RsbW
MCAEIIQVDVVIPTQTKYLELIGQLGEHIVQKIDTFATDKDALAYQLNLVLTEATANAIKHGHHNNPKDSVKITIHIQDDAINIKVYDHGQGFDLKSVLSPDLNNPKENGLGLFFIRSLMDSVSYTKIDDGNVLEIIKYLGSTGEHPDGR